MFSRVMMEAPKYLYHMIKLRFLKSHKEKRTTNFQIKRKPAGELASFDNFIIDRDLCGHGLLEPYHVIGL